MSTTPKPLRLLLTDPAMLQWPEVQKLIAQKHIVSGFGEGTYDLILGPRCWRMDESLRDYFDDAIAEARKVKYPPKPKEAPTT